MDKDLEAAIDGVGRERVFALVRAAGWSAADSPPKWVWWNAVRTLKAEDAGEC